MANAFSRGRLSLWHSSPRSFGLDYPRLKELGFTDVFFNASDGAVKADLDDARKHVSWDGYNFRPHISIDGTHGQTGTQLTATALDRIAALAPGCIEVDFEGDDNHIGTAVRELLQTFRVAGTWRQRLPIGINVVPMKAYVMPVPANNSRLIVDDPYTFVRVQRYYGAEMRPADPAECLEDWLDRGLPREKFTFMESGKARRLSDGKLFIDWPVFSDGGVFVRRQRSGAVFSANLLREAGLI